MFPFIDINRKDLVEYSNHIEKILCISDVIHPCINVDRNDIHRHSSLTSNPMPILTDQAKTKGYLLEAIAFSLQFLKQEKNVSFEDNHFIDCLGNGGEACLYAQIFGFESLLSVELNSSSFERGKNRLDQLVVAYPGIYQEDKISLVRGSFLENYCAADFKFLFLDTTILRSSMLDESILINRFLQFCTTALLGSFFILVTVTSSINLSDYYPHGEEIFRHEFSSEIGEDATGIIIFSLKRI